MEQMNGDGQYDRMLLDVIDVELVVVDSEGVIRFTNAAWNRFAGNANAANVQSRSVGANYLAVLLAAMADNVPMAKDVHDGLCAVIDGSLDSYEVQYPCAAEGQEQWFLMRAVPLRAVAPRPVVVSHLNITHLRQSAVNATQGKHEREVEQQQQREVSFLETISGQSAASITAAFYGKLPIHDTTPSAFGGLVSRYGQVLERAVEQRTYRSNDNLTLELRDLAQQLRFLNAGPRDVIDIHLTAVKALLRSIAGARASFLLEEARPLVLELMGELLSIYRLEAVANRYSATQRETTT